MAEHFLTSVVTVVLAIVGVAFVAMLVSKNAQTGRVLIQGSQALSGFLGTALSPITGGAMGFSGLPPTSLS